MGLLLSFESADAMQDNAALEDLATKNYGRLMWSQEDHRKLEDRLSQHTETAHIAWQAGSSRLRQSQR